MKTALKILAAIVLLIISCIVVFYSLISNGIINFSIQNDQQSGSQFRNTISIHDATARNLDLKKVYRQLGDLESYANEINDKAIKEFESRNGSTKPFSEDAKKAISFYTAYLVSNDFYGEGLLQEANIYALKAYCNQCRDSLINSIVFFHDDRNSFHFKKASFVDLSDAFHNIDKSEYPNIYKLAICCVTLETMGSTKLQKDKWQEDMSGVVNDIPTYFNDFTRLWRESLAKESSIKVINEQIIRIIDDLTPYDSVMDLINQHIDNILSDSNIPLETATYIKGRFFVSYAWTARGNGFSKEVKPESWAIFRERLDKASSILIPAIEKFPNNPYLPTEMITVALGKEEDRNTMEYYFKKAVTADPHYYIAYRQKQNYLEPRWYGTPKDVIDFGAECIKTGDWEHKIPCIMAVGVYELTTSDFEKVFQNEQLWKIVQYVYTEYLNRYPESIKMRTKYLRDAVYGHQWSVAKEQYRILGSNWDRGVLSKAEYVSLLRQIP